MNVFAVHGDENHRMPYLDVVGIGVNLPDGTGEDLAFYVWREPGGEWIGGMGGYE